MNTRHHRPQRPSSVPISGDGAPAFEDRADAGRRLADRVAELGLHDPLVLGLPRGGVPIAREIADRLGAPMEAFVSRKIALPDAPEVGLAAIAEGSGEIVLSPFAQDYGYRTGELAGSAEAERRELARRVDTYRGERALPELAGRELVLADDGLATGVTAMAAVRALRRWQPGKLVFAAPVCAADAVDHLVGLVDVLVSLLIPERFEAVGLWYRDFAQLTDEDVIRLLRADGGAGSSSAGRPGQGRA